MSVNNTNLAKAIKFNLGILANPVARMMAGFEAVNTKPRNSMLEKLSTATIELDGFLKDVVNGEDVSEQLVLARQAVQVISDVYQGEEHQMLREHLQTDALETVPDLCSILFDRLQAS